MLPKSLITVGSERANSKAYGHDGKTAIYIDMIITVVVEIGSSVTCWRVVHIV